MASKRKPKHPYDLPQRKPLWQQILFNPTRIAIAGSAATATLYPVVSSYGPGIRLHDYSTQISEALCQMPYLQRVLPRSPRVYASLTMFLLMYGSWKSLAQLRKLVLRRLLSWQGWVTDYKSFKTKIWALSTKLLIGPGPYSTYEFQSVLPKEPLPSLDDTLDMWLNLAEQLVTEEEFIQTKQAVAEFRQNEGPKIQAYLQKRAKTEVNWMYEFWLTAAYLSSREPLPMRSNYDVSSATERSKDQLSRGATIIWNYARFAELLRNNHIQPVMLQGFVPLCMYCLKYVFNSVRLPQEGIDKLEIYPHTRHIVVLRKGQYFKLDMYKKVKRNKRVMISKQELYWQFKKICDLADEWEREMGGSPLPVSALTSQNRNTWAKQRLQLAELNKDTLEAIETAMFLVHLPHEHPKDESDFSKQLQVGTGNDRWFDKNFTSVAFPGGWYGSNTEHSHIDAFVFAASCEFVTVYDGPYDEKGMMLGINDAYPITLDTPERLDWNLNGMEEHIQVAAKKLKEDIDNFDVTLKALPYGKRQMKAARMSPDGYIQMALQLAFYRLHKYVPKTYEPATRRLFVLGRTETIHAVSSAMKAWIKAMDDPFSSDERRISLLRDAVRHQTQYRLDATVGKACDRHLLAMLCVSRVMGMDMPKIFMDKAWRMPFDLSTSQTPTDMYNQNTPNHMRWDMISGGFGPGSPQGYGCCYTLLGEDVVSITITSWKSPDGTHSSVKFGESLDKAMTDMLQLLERKSLV